MVMIPVHQTIKFIDMKCDSKILGRIYDKTNGACHICHKKLSFSNYGIHGAKASWHVDHSVPRAKGGSDHPNNLFPACISCNLEKGIVSTRAIRNKYGNTRAPLSKKRKQRIQDENAIGGAAIGGAIGLIAGPVGGLVGAFIGAVIGYDESPKN